MNKKICSNALLCLTSFLFLLLILLFVDAGISIYQLNNTTVDTSNDILPCGSILGIITANFAIWGGCLLFGFAISSVGFFSSLINTKIATNPLLAKISTVYLYVFSAVLILIVISSIIIII